MSYLYSRVDYNVGQIHMLDKQGRIKFDNIIQRGLVWDIKMKSKFIHSLAVGIPIPTIYARQIDGVLDILDGKQRLSTICQYLDMEFQLSRLEPVEFFNLSTGKNQIEDMSGKSFHELSSEIQNVIKAQIINMTLFSDLNEVEMREVFKRLNSGKTLNVKGKVLASVDDLEKLIGFSENKFFKEIFTEKSIENKEYVYLILRCYMVTYMDINTVSFNRDRFYDIVEDMDMTDEQRHMMEKIFNYAFDIYSISKTKEKQFIRSTINIISLSPFIKKSIDNGLSVEKFYKWIEAFVKDKNGYGAFKIKARVMNSKMIVERNDILSEYYNLFFKEV